jgi:hypothetical protein
VAFLPSIALAKEEAQLWTLVWGWGILAPLWILDSGIWIEGPGVYPPPSVPTLIYSPRRGVSITMKNSPSIAIELLFVALAIMFALNISSCKKQNGEAQVKRQNNQELTLEQKGEKLAQDFIAAGFTPFKPFPMDNIDPSRIKSVIDGIKSVSYANGSISFDADGKVTHFMVYVLDSPRTDTNNPSLQVRTYAGSDLLKLTKKEFKNLYGVSKSFADSTKEHKVFRYEYRIERVATVHISIGFTGDKDSDTVKMISAGCSSGKEIEQLLKLDDMKKYYVWPR